MCAVLLTDVCQENLNRTLAWLQQRVEQYNHEARWADDIIYSVGALLFDAARHAGIADLMAEADVLMYAQKEQSRLRTGRVPGSRYLAMKSGPGIGGDTAVITAGRTSTPTPVAKSSPLQQAMRGQAKSRSCHTPGKAGSFGFNGHHHGDRHAACHTHNCAAGVVDTV